jgi:hypothetical protein
VKAVRILAIVFACYVGLGLLFDSVIGSVQPQFDGTVVLRTFEPGGGEPKDTVLSLLNDNGQLWVESGHWFRGWYRRVQANPEVELTLDGQTAPYRAIADESPETVEHVTNLMKRANGGAYYVARTMLLWAPIKPVRLEPKAVASAEIAPEAEGEPETAPEEPAPAPAP